jgi:hypothetical protein
MPFYLVKLKYNKQLIIEVFFMKQGIALFSEHHIKDTSSDICNKAP